ncbi:MAG: flagellar motor protein MotB [Gammaproteobacteria bacterium]|nr:MAG: flagellar motor protein MotB [Gammaproteobacteria bacterium]
MKLLTSVGLFAVALSLAACTSTVENNVNNEGQLAGGELVWPKMEDALIPEGIFPNLENLSKIGPGMTKKELYNLIERPHFSETHAAKEWNYIMKFRQADRSVKICQYKVLFDRDRVAQSFYWLPEDCLNEKFDLSADALFPFNRGGVNDIKPAGKKQLDTLAAHLAKKGSKYKVHLVGHTDYLGSDAYNMALSQQRANSVGRYLVMKGVNPANITTEGRGESQPVKRCDNTGSPAALRRCLAPNRRVTVDIKGHH